MSRSRFILCCGHALIYANSSQDLSDAFRVVRLAEVALPAAHVERHGIPGLRLLRHFPRQLSVHLGLSRKHLPNGVLVCDMP